ncbi:cyd operon YbgE family protein [Microbulbifer bruguierae]|uniref:Cyd operon YbgE family protein n=1 Tax=Microbulbifer bruguierae TaxID=3029061 RepID=A0ABY8NHW7_9GAMM|nr:cyd operon YbgE family protein [Microbulbifer bruguierae]WGL17677.1 cyd operon YbgE family protein [Microbulbifer bruguierae]
MQALRVVTFAASLLASLAITFWPLLLYRNDMPPSTGQTSMLMLGLCVGVIYGSGILAKTPRNWQLGCAVIAWLSLAIIGWLALPP